MQHWFNNSVYFCKKIISLFLNVTIMKYLSSILIFVIFINTTFSQKDSTDLIKREKLTYDNIIDIKEKQLKIVSASRSAKSMVDIPVTVYVITHDEIIKNGYVTLIDVLKSVPGMKISQPHSAELGEAFLQMGLLGNSYTKILINNIPIKPSVVIGMPIAAQLPIRQAERIEIVFGPASAVYGADAASGVINIITKNPEDGFYALADMEFGTGAYNYGNFMIGGKTGKNKNVLEYNIYGSKLNHGNMNIYHEKDRVYSPWHYFQQTQSNFKYQDESGNVFEIEPMDITDEIIANSGYSLEEISHFMRNYQGELHKPAFSKIPQESDLIGIEMKYRGIRFSYNHLKRRTHSSIGLTSMLYSYNNPNNFYGEAIDRLTLDIGYQFKKLSSNTSFTYLKYRMDEASTRGVNYFEGYDEVYVYSASDDFLAEHNITYTPFDKLEIIGGASYQYSGNLPSTNESIWIFNPGNYKSFKKNEIPDDPIFGQFGYNPILFSTYGAYLQADFSFWKISLIAGTRYDNNSIYGESISPRYALLFKFSKKFAMRLSLTNAYKAPSSSLIYNSIAVPEQINENNMRLSYQLIPNPSLKPEKINGIELGMRYFFGTNSFVDIVFFNSLVENLIIADWTLLDTDKYNGVGASESNYLYTRTNVNKEDAVSTLLGMQIIFVSKSLIDAINLNIQAGITLSQGTEIIPESEEIEIEKVKLSNLRQTPEAMMHLSFDMNPLSNLYIRIENIYMDNWMKAYLPSDTENIDKNYFTTDHFFNTDLVVNFKLGKQLSINSKIINLFNSEYGGIDARGMDVDLKYNPQLKRNIRFGITYKFN